MTWLAAEAEGRTPFERVFRLRPNLYEAWAAFATHFWTERVVDPVVLELCRLRIAELVGARWPRSKRMDEATLAGLDEAKIAKLGDWWNADGFSDTERVCLRFAEQFSLDPHGIGDDDARAVVEALGEAGTVAFVEALAIFDGFGRFCRMLEIEEERS